MGRQTITIPADGQFKIINLTGRSIIIEQMNKYSEAAQVPKMDLINGVSDYPLYNLSTYPNSEIFNTVKIYGTAESAGDEITLFSTNACLDLDIKVDFAGQYEVEPGTTQEETLSDTVFQFSEIAIADAEGNLPKAVYLEAVEDEVKFAFNVDPVQGAGGLGYILETPSNQIAVDPLKVEGINFILALRFINATNLTDAKLNYTFEY